MGNPSAKPPHAKRRRDPDEPRPKKKKIRISKRQPQYHSSSEDEGSDNASSANAIPLKPRVPRQKATEEITAPAEKIAEETATKPSATPAKAKSTPAKPILKHTLPIKTKKPAPESDDEDEEELPELVFGTASVPIFVRIPGASASAAGREPFAGALEAYQPLRSELTRLVASAHEARERKAAMEAAAKQVEKDAANVDDGQTTIDERSTSNNPGQTDAAINSGAVGSNGHRVSASETIDSETAVILGSAGLASVPAAAHQDGLGDVVSRMMAQPAHPTISESSVVPAPAILSGVQPDRFTEAPRPSIGVNSNLSRDETLLTLPDHDAAEPYNTSTITLDPLLGDTHTHTRTETNNG